MVGSILDVLDEKSLKELVPGEVEALSSILACVRKEDETSTKYASRFTETVDVYVNLTSALTLETVRQSAIFLLKNAKLMNDTINAVMFQLTSKEGGIRDELTKGIILEGKVA